MPSGRNALLPVALSALAAAGAVAVGSPAAAQETEAPVYRDDGPYLLVCSDDAEDFAERNDKVVYTERIVNERLYGECLDEGYRDLAGALEHVAEPGTRILILPGRYVAEEAVVVDGAEGLQIEGLGDSPDDVQLSVHYAADAVIEANDSAGLYLKGFTVEQGREAGLVVRGAAGATVDGVRSVRNGGHGMHVEDSTAVRLTACGASGNDDAGIALEDTDAEVTECDSGENLIGLKDSGGGRVVVESSRLHDNTTGLVVTATTEGHSLTASGNAVYDNNADHYANLGNGRCDADPSERDWAAGGRCPAEAVPMGVGILVAGGNDTAFTGNNIWGQNAAAVMVLGSPGADDTASHRNRFEGNTFGYRDDGQRSRNRLDLWWDGKGEGDCFAEPTAEHTTPAVLPSCGEGSSGRLLAEPVKAFKVWYCETGPITGAVPAGCDWFGATFTDRLEVQAAVAFAAALLFLTGAGWFGAARSPEPPPPMSMTFSAIATCSGALLLVLASWSGRSEYEALAIGLWGFGWILAGRSWFSSGLGVFGAFTVLIGGLAIVDAVDRGVWIVPLIPVSPAWMWLALLPLWVLLALGAVLRRRRPREHFRPPVQRTPATVPVHDRFDW
ncbi:right-handed parallel beta-helix repeat-containing protein [Glycomyces arizonensis]|uniref:right-handed parallel beta-helix repeat-containing protein n=1 Tax=Glycomyces arizonensis TaxID=256035 RepID=UPI00040889D6|nr:right-handed parallel beta-helix repeat-containing protein [Glycomyces arizonensis]